MEIMDHHDEDNDNPQEGSNKRRVTDRRENEVEEADQADSLSNLPLQKKFKTLLNRAEETNHTQKEAAAKPRLLKDEENAAKIASSLPDGVLRLIFACAGSGQFQFVGGTCRQWRLACKQQFQNACCAKMEQVAKSIPRCRMFLREATWSDDCMCSTEAADKSRILLCWFAAFHGRLDLLKWVLENSLVPPIDTSACAHAAKSGQANVLQWLRENGFHWDCDTCANAARDGHFEVLKWARANGCNWDYKTCLGAAENGHVEIFKWARDEECPCEHRLLSMLIAAVKNGHLDVICKMTWDGVIHHCWYPSLCDCAAENGHLEILQWLRQHECPWDVHACESAAENSHIKVFQWARQNGCPCNALACAHLAKNGHLEALQWARQHDCPWDSRTLLWAAQNGHLDVVNWARENGCEWLGTVDLEDVIEDTD